ncbi:MAG: PAS domain S-box protein [Candidatus Heimdallarchaeota archaeon]|nr:PAS domain S-box protein [Candidatus Heimdallarchaeota archaeon]
MNPSDEANLLRETFDVIFQNSLDMIFLVDEEGSIREANIQACRYFGQTLDDLKAKALSNFILEKKLLNEFFTQTIENGQELQKFTFITKQQDEVAFQISSTLVVSIDTKLIVLICRDIQDLVDSEHQRQFFFELFQHDLLNKLHAEIGYIDFFRRLYDSQMIEKLTGIQMIDKMRDITVRSIYLIQNANIMLLLQEEKSLTAQNLEDVLKHTSRYIDSFFAKRVKLDINRIQDVMILGDEFIYRIFVNLIVRMMEYSDDTVMVDITVGTPVYETVKAKLHFEGIVLSPEDRRELHLNQNLDRKKLDITVIQKLLNRYQMELKIDNVRRSGEIVGTKMTLSIPIIIPESLNI